ncbi:MAG TPA: DUF2272 domain-containing protein [Nitrospiria bacterium]|nr:DUF2272 domain-containing protein [Nitrospiria bacterium]
MRTPIQTVYVLMLCLVGCHASSPPVIKEADVKPAEGQFIAEASHSPPFARMPYEPFTRADAVAIAEQEWRLFGERVDDDPPPPGGYAPVPGDDPARAPGQWERIGEYWWLGQDDDRRESAWTGMHDEKGQAIDESREDDYAWSAAFISYVMRTAGAGARFPYSPSHYVYINIGKEMKLGRTSGWVVVAEPVDSYAPAPGDLICYGRERYKLTYEMLPRQPFAAHCDIVVAQDNRQISVIGGNVDHAVTMKHVPVTMDGRLADPGEHVLDARYPWLLVLQILYDR